MSDEPMDELETLLSEWELSSLDQAGRARLQDILRSDAAARKRFVTWQMVHAALKLEGDLGGELPTSNSPDQFAGAGAGEAEVRRVQRGVRPLKGTRWSWMIAVTAALLICMLAGRWGYLEWQAGNGAEQTAAIAKDASRTARVVEATARGLALVTQLVDVQWENPSAAAEIGDALTRGKIAIKSGYVQIEFFCGATVILEGPAELEIDSSTTARCLSGRLRAQVPPAARGFEVHVGEMRVVDLGTEFGLSVSDGGANVQVFDGEVELHRPQAQMQRVRAGQAFVLAADEALSPSRVTPEQFVDLAKLELEAKDQTAARYQRWKEYSAALRRDPRLIAYYAFDESDLWRRKLRSSLLPENRELDGAIVGARRRAGRWPAKGGLEFKRPGDRVRVNIPGEFGSLTLACWVRIDSLDRWYNSLFLTDNYQQGEPHWQILDSGQLFFSVRVSRFGEKGPEHREVLSPVFWKPSMSGQWLQLATTYDVERKRTTHYLNGKMLSQEAIPDHQLVPVTRIGMASMGNWSTPTKPDVDFAIRNLNGSVDEFALFSAALSAEEIEEFYEKGRP